MTIARIALFLFGAAVLTGPITGQDPTKKEEPKKEEPKKEEPKAKGFLPMGWRELGLSEAQKQQVYKIQAKHGDEIDKLMAQIQEIKGRMAKERLEVLTPEQKKKYEDYLKGKLSGDK